MATSDAIAAEAAPAEPGAFDGAGPDTSGAGDYEPGVTSEMRAEMQAMMTEDAPAGDAPATPPAPAETPPSPAEPKPPEEPAPPAEPGEPVAATAATLAAETIKLRKGWAALAKDKEALVLKGNEATAAIERAKTFEAKAKELDGLPEQFAADPLAFMYRFGGKKTLEEQEAFVSALLDKIVEGEKSPIEREMARLRQEIAAKDREQTQAKADAEAKAAQAENDRAIQEWASRNTSFASSTPENIEKYDLINALDQGEAVHQTCVAYHNQWYAKLAAEDKHKAILDPAQAADYVEAHLRRGAEKSKWLKSKFAVSPPAPAPAPARATAPVTAQPSNGTTAPKRTGTPTLSNVASEGSAPSAAGYPEESDQRMEAVMREMQAAGELPDEWRVSGPAH